MPPLPVYLDYNATTPVDPAVLEAMLPFLTTWFGNPSSSHAWGTRARAAVEEARGQVAALLGATPGEVVFTSGGTESNNTAVLAMARALRGRGRHVVTTAIEHPAVLEPCAVLETEGFRVTRLPVDGEGRVSPRDAAEALTDETVLVSVMHANNEVGTLQDVAEIARLAHARGALVHTDAAQSAGKVPVDVGALGVDLLSLAGHKLYAPKGVGALFVRSGIALPRYLHGASHEAGRRAGTENVAGIVGLGAACAIARERLAIDPPRLEALRERLFEGLAREAAPVRRNSPREGCLPNTLSVAFRGLEAPALLAEIGDRVAASPGAACHSSGVVLSSVLAAMRVPVEDAKGTVRFSVGRDTTEAGIDAAVGAIAEAANRMRGGA
jgi:cysteine desulfurase